MDRSRRRPDMLQRFIDPAAVAAEIERVRSLSGHALRRRWQSAFGRSPPEHLTADLLHSTVPRSNSWTALPGAGGSRPAERNLKIGTVLVRDFKAGATPSRSR